MSVNLDLNNTTVGYLCSTVICVVALCVDGMTAITLSLGVASSLTGLGGVSRWKETKECLARSRACQKCPRSC